MGTVGDDYEVEFQWKERVIHWEGRHGVVFGAAWGTDPLVTYVPDPLTWDRVVPTWLRGRHDEVTSRLRADERHAVREQRDDSSNPGKLEVVSR